jgi:riboflavin kinase / FMN adenylyltransferase
MTLSASPDILSLANLASGLPASMRGGAVALGNFDGVHLGHRQVLALAQAEATKVGGPSVMLSFEPHPRSLFQPDVPLFRLTPPAIKRAEAMSAGMAAALFLNFDRALAGLSAEDFIDQVLVKALGARVVLAGPDFRFGKARRGDMATLAGIGAKAGFTVVTTPAFALDGEIVSSSGIRQALTEGGIAKATAWLGRPWRVEAVVQHGDKRGRLLNYPTANLHLDPATGLKLGIYAVRVKVGPTMHQGVASFGKRPTFDDGMAKLEVHLFDFAGDLYGQTISVEFIAFLRPEARFDGIEPLIRQMDKDSAEARQILSAKA